MSKDHIPGHTMDAVAYALPVANGRKATGTAVGCTCRGWRGAGSTDAPSSGGLTEVTRQHRGHIADVASRDPRHTAALARQEWRPWQPGDGTCYRVRIVTVVGGPDQSDNILLINVARKAWAVQYATVPYRLRGNGAMTASDGIALGLPVEIWRAAHPLLAQLGACRAV